VRRIRVTSALARFAFVVLPLCIAVSCSGVQKPAILGQPAPAIVKGRVFLITRGGDLKPARLADIYLLSASALQNQQAIKDRQDYVESMCTGAESTREMIATDTVGNMAKVTRSYLSSYKDGLTELEKLFYASVGQKDTFAMQADEDGRFSFERVPQGSYVIVAFGQAGVNLGYWQAALTVTTGDQPEVKLSAPVTACAML